MERIFAQLDKNRAYGITLLRVAAGLILFQSGYAKVFVYGFPAVTQSFTRMGIFLPQVAGPFIGLLELVGGGALVLGILTRYLGVVFAVEFLVAAWVIASSRGLVGARLELLLIAIGLFLAANGGGALNLGKLLRKGH